MSDPKHPIWSIARIAVVGTTVGIVLHFGYDNGFIAAKDVPTILIMLLSNVGMEQLQAIFQKPK